VVAAEARRYTDALSGQTALTWHVRLDGLEPASEYVYEVLHAGAVAEAGRFRTAPDGRQAPFRFTAFGDQSVPAPVGRGLGPSSPHAAWVVDAVESLDPLFHLLNGDLCYANVSDDPVGTWASFFANDSRSARNRPWMPCAGNHENEVGNGPIGYLAYQTRFALPDNGQPPGLQGQWYAFTAGSVRVISINNDDVCIQDGSFNAYRRDHIRDYSRGGLDPYVRGYSGGVQRAWLERELMAARMDDGIDWIVVCMHQVAMSSGLFNGADLGIRQQFLPLFDAYGVDLVVTGHEHHFERSLPVRGVVAGSDLLTPAVAGTDPHRIDTTDGTVHMTIGGGGNPVLTPLVDADEPHGYVIHGVGPGNPISGRPPMRATEAAAWSAYRGTVEPYGFAAFEVDPGVPGGPTTITVTYYGARQGSPDYRPLDRFVLRRPRADVGGGSDDRQRRRVATTTGS